MARQRTLTSDIRTEMVAYLERQGSIPSTARGFYQACENDDKVNLWLRHWGRDSIIKSMKGVWSSQPRTDGPGLRKLAKAKKPFPEILILPRFEDGHYRKILTRFARVNHLELDLRVKEDNAEMILAALKETRGMVQLAVKEAHGRRDTWITTITTETLGDWPPDDDEEGGDDE